MVSNIVYVTNESKAINTHSIHFVFIAVAAFLLKYTTYIHNEHHTTNNKNNGFCERFLNRSTRTTRFIKIQSNRINTKMQKLLTKYWHKQQKERAKNMIHGGIMKRENMIFIERIGDACEMSVSDFTLQCKKSCNSHCRRYYTSCKSHLSASVRWIKNTAIDVWLVANKHI